LLKTLFDFRLEKESQNNTNNLENHIDEHNRGYRYVNSVVQRKQSFVIRVEPCSQGNNVEPKQINENGKTEKKSHCELLVLHVSPSHVSEQKNGEVVVRSF
jgi:hypothetical protein